MLSEISLILAHFKQPEYIHVLINPLPFWGMAIGFLLLAFSLIKNNSGVQTAALILIACIGAATWVVAFYGERAEDRVESMSNQEAQSWLETHEHRAERLQYVFYGTALLALGTLAANRAGLRSRKKLLLATLLSVIACVLAAGWIAHAGGQIRHSEFRDGPPPGG